MNKLVYREKTDHFPANFVLEMNDDDDDDDYDDDNDDDDDDNFYTGYTRFVIYHCSDAYLYFFKNFFFHTAS